MGRLTLACPVANTTYNGYIGLASLFGSRVTRIHRVEFSLSTGVDLVSGAGKFRIRAIINSDPALDETAGIGSRGNIWGFVYGVQVETAAGTQIFPGERAWNAPAGFFTTASKLRCWIASSGLASLDSVAFRVHFRGVNVSPERYREIEMVGR